MPAEERDAATEKFKSISAAYQVLSNENKRAYYDRHGVVEGSDEDLRDNHSFMDDLMRQFFGGDSAGGLDDFDEFIEILEGGSDRAFRSMFRELGRAARVKPRGNARKAHLNKGGNQRRAMKKME